MEKNNLLRWNAAAPRYTSYPPATSFQTAQGSQGFLRLVEDSNTFGLANISLYFHIPFCPHRCLFCGCNTEIGRNASFIDSYFHAMHSEMSMVLPLLNTERPLTQIHLGGGTPNAVSDKYLAGLLDAAQQRLHWAEDAEVAIECDPALLSIDRLRSLRRLGFNRISFGIQDFDEQVLSYVERKGSRQPVPELVAEARQLGFRGINLDLIYGLPGQTPEGFRDTLQKTIGARPDRIALFSYAHVPWIKEHQKTLESHGLPDAATKIDMFLEARETLCANGWRWIGMDHFALPEDALSVALDQGSLHRNFQGYCTRQTTGQVYAFGASGITQMEAAYGQAIKDSETYTRVVSMGQYPLEKVLVVDREQRMVRQAIETLMCNGRIVPEELAADWNCSVTDLDAVLKGGLGRLESLAADGLVAKQGNALVATEEGRLVIRHLAMQLDPLMVGKASGEGQFSKTI